MVRQLTTVLLRLIAVLLFLSGITSFIQVIVVLKRHVIGEGGDGVFLLGGGFPVIGAVVLWFLAAPLARFLTRGLDDRPSPPEGDVAAWQTAALSVAGVTGIALTLPELAGLSIWLVQYPDELTGFQKADVIAGAVGSGVRLVVGVWLALGSRGIIRIISRLRYMSTK